MPPAEGCGSLRGSRLSRHRRDLLRVAPEYQTDASPATLAVIERQQSAMVLHDFFYDRETEAGALAARRHVGLGQALTALDRQTLAVVLDDDAHSGALVPQAQRNLARRQGSACLGLAPFDRLGAVLQDIGQHLAHLAAIADQRHRMIRQLDLIAQPGIAVALQEERLLAELLGVLRLHRWTRHAGE